MTHTLYGHRGARGEAPENTLSGVAYARRHGVQALEMDVHPSADGQLVVIHDATVDRTTSGTGPVSDFTAAELAGLDARDGFPDWPEAVGIPTLDEMLSAHGDVRALQLEVKTAPPGALEQVCRLLAAAIERFGIGERTVVTSFDGQALEIMRALAPGVCRGYISAAPYAGDVLADAVRLGCSLACVHLPANSAETVREVRRSGLEAAGWLGNTVDDLRTLVEWGVDSITTDLPSLAIPYLESVGWLAPGA